MQKIGFLVLILGLNGCLLESQGSQEIEAEMVVDQSKNPPLGWSKSGKLIPGNTSRGLAMQKQFPIAGVYTAQFNIDQGNQPINVRVRAEAIIDWTVAGNSVRRIISVYDGVSISGTASAVNIAVRDTSIALATPIEYSVSIQITPGTRASHSMPPFLERDGAVIVAPAASSDRTVPIDAGVIAVYTSLATDTLGTPIASGDVRIRHIDNNASVLKSYDPVLVSGWVPLSPGTTEIRYEVDAGVGSDVRFQTTFGIEG